MLYYYNNEWKQLLMTKNYLNYAQSFLSSYKKRSESEKKEKLEASNELFIRRLIRLGAFVLQDKELDQFFKMNEALLQSSGPNDFATADGYIDFLIQNTDLFWDSSIDEEQETEVANQFDSLSDALHKQLLSPARLLFNDSQLPRSAQDIRSKLGDYTYRIDEFQFPYWPINQIGGHRLYAAMGCPVLNENNTEQSDSEYHPFKFLYTLMNPQNGSRRNDPTKLSSANIGTEAILGSEPVDFKNIVAIGEPGIDYHRYFLEAKQYKKTLSDGTILTMDVNPKLITADEASPLRQHEMNVTMTSTSGEKEAKISKIFSVWHILLKDGYPIQLDDASLKRLHSILDEEDTIVHCQAGLGRTGQFILERILRAELDYIFQDNDQAAILQRLNEIVTEMRAYRPGLIIVSEQLFAALENAYRYALLKTHELENKASPDELISEISTDMEKISLNSSQPSLRHPMSLWNSDNKLLAVEEAEIEKSFNYNIKH